jgi:hypothetical protein
VLAGVVGVGIVGYATTAMRRGATAPCGCFGESSGRAPGVRNLVAGVALLAVAVVLLALPGSGRASPAMSLPLVAVLGLTVVLVRDRSRVLAPFERHFGWHGRSHGRAVPAGPVPSGAEVS